MAAATLVVNNPNYHYDQHGYHHHTNNNNMNDTTTMMPTSVSSNLKKIKKKSKLLNPITMMRMRSRDRMMSRRDLESSDGDISTIDTNDYNNIISSVPTYTTTTATATTTTTTATKCIPEQAPASSLSPSPPTAASNYYHFPHHQFHHGEGLEVAESFLSPNNDYNNNASGNRAIRLSRSGDEIQMSPPPRPLSPLSTVSSFSANNNKNLPPIVVTSNNRSGSSDDLDNHLHHQDAANNTKTVRTAIPSPIPPRGVGEQGPSTKPHRKRSSPGAKAKEETCETAPPPPQPPTSSLWQELVQRCFLDCYCMSNHYQSTSTTTTFDNTTTMAWRGNTDANTVAVEVADKDNTNSDDFVFSSLFPVDDGEEDVAKVMPKLCRQLDLSTTSIKVRSNAIREVAQLCDRERSHNRIAMVCTSQWDVVTALCRVLQDPNTPLKDYRQGLLILSNLTLPMENKAVLLLGSQRDILLETLYMGLHVLRLEPLQPIAPTSSSSLSSSSMEQQQQQQANNDNDNPSQNPIHHNARTATILQQRKLEVHLVCAVLFNLSFLQDGKSILINYRPPAALVKSSSSSLSQQSHHHSDRDNPSSSPLLEDSYSLLRTLEHMMLAFQPFVAPVEGREAKDLESSSTSFFGLPLPAPANLTSSLSLGLGAVDTASVERQAIRWTCGMMRNLCSTPSSQEFARIIGHSQIPRIALELIRYTPSTNHGQWRTQSMEDLALSLLVELALREQEHDKQQQQLGSGDKNNSSDVLVPVLYDVSCQQYLQPLLDAGAGIHSLRAQAIVKRFDSKIGEFQPQAEEGDWVGDDSSYKSATPHSTNTADDPYLYFNDKQKGALASF